VSEPTPAELAVHVAAALEQAGVGYFLGGSVASSLQGQPRLTNDIDFVVDLRESQVAGLAEALGPDFEVDQEALGDAVRHKGSWNIFHLPTVTRIDLFVLREGDFDAEEFLRRKAEELLPGKRVMVKTPEDSVLRRATGSTRATSTPGPDASASRTSSPAPGPPPPPPAEAPRPRLAPRKWGC